MSRKTRVCAWLAAMTLASLLAGCSAAPAAEDKSAPPNVAVAPAPAPLTTDVSVELTPEKTEYFLGEPVYVRLEVKNNTAKAGWLAIYGRQAMFRAWNEAEEPVPPRKVFLGNDFWEVRHETVPGPWKLEPGEGRSAVLTLGYLRFSKPGPYRVGVRAPISWGAQSPDEERKAAEIFGRESMARPEQQRTWMHPSDFQIVFREPETKEAAKVVGEIMASHGRNPLITSPMQERAFESLELPVYFPRLAELANSNDAFARRLAVIGIDFSILTPEATLELVRLLGSKDPVVVLHAAQALSNRMPRHEPPVPPDFHWPGETERAERSALAWRDGMARDVLDWSRARLKKGSLEEIGWAARFVQYLGKPDDLPFLAKGIDQVAPDWTDWRGPLAEPEESRPGKVIYWIRWAAVVLRAAGAKPPDQPSSPGEAVLWTWALSDKPETRPAGWETSLEKLLSDNLPLVRCSSLARLPVPFAPAIRPIVLDRLHDQNSDVRYAAFLAIARSKDPTFSEAVVEQAQRETSNWNLGVALLALEAVEAKHVLVDMSIAHLTDDSEGDKQGTSLTFQAFRQLVGWCVRDGSLAGGRSIRDQSEAKQYQERWKAWVAGNREAVNKEGGFVPGDPRLDLKLFPPGYTIRIKGRTLWDPSKEPVGPPTQAVDKPSGPASRAEP